MLTLYRVSPIILIAHLRQRDRTMNHQGSERQYKPQRGKCEQKSLE